MSEAAYKLKYITHDTDNINDLITSIIARFNYIIDMVGSDVPVTVYKDAIHELQTKYFDWLEIEEHDSLMKPKKDELIYMLTHTGLSKALAREQFGFTEST